MSRNGRCRRRLNGDPSFFLPKRMPFWEKLAKVMVEFNLRLDNVLFFGQKNARTSGGLCHAFEFLIIFSMILKPC